MTIQPNGSEQPTSAAPVCPRHPSEISYVSCQRCRRPACPLCQRPAAVGIHCVDCVKEAARTTRSATTAYGGAPTDGRPLVTYTIIALCVVVYLAQRVQPDVTSRLAFVPALAATEPWRFVTSVFAHSPGSVTHILFNMYAVWLVGPTLEAALGRARFVALYLLAGIGGSVGYLVAQTPLSVLDGSTVGDTGWYSAAVGASGAVFGLFGALLVMQWGRSGTWNPVLLAMLGINLAMPLFVAGIAWEAHIGGLITGAVIGLVFSRLGGKRSALAPASTKASWGVHWVGLAAVAAVLAALSLIKLL